MINFPGIILAGGLSRRMGGGDKGLMDLGDKTILERVIENIEPQVCSLAIPTDLAGILTLGEESLGVISLDDISPR